MLEMRNWRRWGNVLLRDVFFSFAPVVLSLAMVMVPLDGGTSCLCCMSLVLHARESCADQDRVRLLWGLPDCPEPLL